MYGLQFGCGLRLEVFSNLRYEHIHAPAQEVIVLAPNVHQYLIPLQYTVCIEAQIAHQVCFALRELVFYFIVA